MSSSSSDLNSTPSTPHPGKVPSPQDNAPNTGLPVGGPPPYSALSPHRRRMILGIVAVAGFFGPLAAGVYLPSLPTFGKVFHGSTTTINGTVSVFMAMLAIAPLFWASHADHAGRKPLYQVSLAIYIASNVLLATLPPNLGALYVLRILQGFGAASGLSLGAGTVADVVPPKGRAGAMSVVLLGPQLGPVLGPLLGGAIAGGAGWRWIFGFLAITCSALYVVLTFCLPETLRSVVGNGAVYADTSLILRPRWRQPCVVDPAEFPKAPPPTLLGLIKLLRYPPVVIVSLNAAILFASYYAMNVTFPHFLEDYYGFSTTGVGVSYLAPGLSLVAGSMTSGRLSDLHRSRSMKNNKDCPPDPEHRLHLQFPGMLLSLTGVIMYGWFVCYRIHVASVIVASSLTAFGMTWVFITTTSYLTESFKKTPATLVALASMFRNPAAAVAAAVVAPLTEKMGIGWCFTGMALVELGCIASLAWLMANAKSMRREFEEREGAENRRPNGLVGK
ncbi:MAG: Dityrosine transporter 1 [Geoglossum simile]|nr:MAG: Dityrosine transporter 1 [Geoglossum simile]